MVSWAGDGNIWLWCALGFALLCAELAVPGIFLMWFGLGALATAALSFTILRFLGWEGQIIVFLICSICAVLAGYRYYKRKKQDNAPFLNNRVAELMGKTYILADPIIDNRGSLHIDDTIWRIHGKNMAAGGHVRIISYKNGALEVEKVSEA